MRDVFPIIPATGGPFWLLACLALFFIGMLALFTWLALASRRTTVVVSAEGLAVRSAVYGRTIPLADLRLETAKPVDTTQGDYRLTLRTNGAGLPGFLAGWFRTAGGEKVLAFVTDKRSVASTRRGRSATGRPKVLAFVTDKRSVAYVPTARGYAVMVSVADPSALIESLRRRAP